MTCHMHVVPLHDGWTLDETLNWLGQHLLLPDIEPAAWATVTCTDGCCPICDY